MMSQEINLNLLEYLAGKKKTRLIEYALEKKRFYQAEAAMDLHWSVSDTQYHLKNFVKHGLLTRIPTVYKTYYSPNLAQLSNLISMQT